ncbi:MAG: hypothetical protein IPJ84_20270 [Bdellovibrionales bacterium]|nr:hypothetical protein [Bdellovibrionales bacterium]
MKRVLDCRVVTVCSFKHPFYNGRQRFFLVGGTVGDRLFNFVVFNELADFRHKLFRLHRIVKIQ